MEWTTKGNGKYSFLKRLSFYFVRPNIGKLWSDKMFEDNIYVDYANLSWINV